MNQDDDDQDAYQRYMVYRPNSMIFLHPKALRGAKRAVNDQVIYMPRPNSFMNAMRGKRFRSPNSFNFYLPSRLAQAEAAQEAAAANVDLDEFYETEKRADTKFDLFLGNRGR